jgi:spermidine/putrescine transport system ATP-binding protein
MASIELRNLVKSFGTTNVVDGVSLLVEAGEFLTFLGPSGCGKTTTLRMVAGFEQPTSGEILFGGESVAGVPAYRRSVNTVFQNYALFPHLTVAGNIEFGLRRKRVATPERLRRVRDAVEMVQLGGLEDRLPTELSGGQQQRVALARALVNRPRVLLLDEPLGALDLKLRRAMQLELKALQRSVGITFVYVTHDQEEAMTMSDRVAVMNRGKLIQIAGTTDIYDRPASRFVASFVGETNFLTGRETARHGGEVEIEIAGIGRIRANAPAGDRRAGDVTIAIRPERLRLGSQAADGANALAATVKSVAFRGSDLIADLALADGTPISVRLMRDTAEGPEVPRPGDRLFVTWRTDATTVLFE